MQIFDLTPQLSPGDDIAHAAGYPFASLEARAFEGGQHKLLPLTSVRGEDVSVFSMLHGDGRHVDGHDFWIVDDMIESGETLLLAAEACRLRGTTSVHLMATHAFCDATVLKRLLDTAITSLIVADTARPIAPSALDPRLVKLSVAPIIGQCLARMHSGLPISPVLDPTGLSR